MQNRASNTPLRDSDAAVQATLVLSASCDPGEFGMSSVASYAGMTEASLRLHFVCKDAMLQAAIDWIDDALKDTFRKTLQSASSPLHALEAVFVADLEFLAFHSGVPRLIAHELQRNELHPNRQRVGVLMREYRERLRKLFEQARERGELDTALDTEMAVTLFTGAMHGCLIRVIALGHTGRSRREALAMFALVRRAMGGPA